MECKYCSGDKYITVIDAYQEYDEGWAEYIDCDLQLFLSQIEDIKFCPMCGNKYKKYRG